MAAPDAFLDELERHAGTRDVADAVRALSALAVAEVLADVQAGVVPRAVRTFAELHDHVDANGYGGAFDWPVGDHSDAYLDAHCRLWNAVQGAVDAWLRAGGLARPTTPAEHA